MVSLTILCASKKVRSSSFSQAGFLNHYLYFQYIHTNIYMCVCVCVDKYACRFIFQLCLNGEVYFKFPWLLPPIRVLGRVLEMVVLFTSSLDAVDFIWKVGFESLLSCVCFVLWMSLWGGLLRKVTLAIAILHQSPLVPAVYFGPNTLCSFFLRPEFFLIKFSPAILAAEATDFNAFSRFVRSILLVLCTVSFAISRYTSLLMMCCRLVVKIKVYHQANYIAEFTMKLSTKFIF